VENTRWEGQGEICCHVRSSKDGSTRLCRLRTASVGPCVTSIDYILEHTRFMGSLKFTLLEFTCFPRDKILGKDPINSRERLSLVNFLGKES
jgi:hypothetical protein